MPHLTCREGMFWTGLVAALLFPAAPISAQEHTVTGRVSSAELGPLAGVEVQVEGTTVRAITNATGEYALTVPESNGTLVFSLLGYRTQTITISGRSTINATLEPEALELAGLVVVGYGRMRAEDFAGSLVNVNRQALERQPLTSPEQALTGQVAGLEVTTSTGIPGSAPQIQLRGSGAVGAGMQPLFVIDGFALPQPDDQARARFRNPLADIPAEDIESITVLKDAAATAIYGSRASNGVVIIETKSGSATAPQVNITAYSGIQSDMDWMIPEVVTAREFAQFQNFIWQARIDRGEAEQIPEMYRNPEQYGEGTDWLRLARRDAWMHNLQVSMSGGSNSVRSYLSAGAQQQQGVAVGTAFRRLSLRANIDADLSDRVHVGLRLAPSYTSRNLPQMGEARGGALGLGYMACPIPPAYLPDGSLNPYIVCDAMRAQPNPLHQLNNVQDEQDAIRALGSAYVDWELLDGLTARTSFNVDRGHSERQEFWPSTVGIEHTSPPPNIPEGEIESRDYLNWLNESTLNLATELGPGQLNALVGITFQRETNVSGSFTGVFPDDEIRTLNVASDLVGETNEQSWSLMSYLARASYSLLDRYVFVGTIRADGSSRFGAQSRWGIFPSAAVAWQLHNEPLLSGLRHAFSELTLRASVGVTGNNQIGNYPHLGVVERDDYVFGSSIAGGRRLASMPNERLGWERTNELNLGLDARTVNDRLDLTVDAYYRRTNQLLLERDLPTTSGFSSVTENLGAIRNMGLELSLRSLNVSRDNFDWTSTLTWSMNRNKVLDLPGDEPIFSGGAEGYPTHVTRVGQPIGMFIGYRVGGIYQNQDDIARLPSFDGAVPGNLIWLDVNGDGEVHPGPAELGGDFAVIGNPHPDFTFGITNQLRLGRFDARIHATGRVGGDINRREYWRTLRNIDGIFVISRDYYRNFWRSEAEPGDGLTPTPLGGGEARRRYRGQHDLNIHDGSNFWIRNITLRYSVPEGVGGFSGAGVYFTVQNPWIITGYPGNPEVQRNAGQGGNFGALVQGVDWIPYPVARQFTVGVELSL